MLSLSDQDFEKLTSFIHQKYGINLAKKRVLIEGRLSNTLRQRGIASFEEYLKILFADQSGSEMTTLLNKLTTNHTYFLRENEHFEYLRTTVLPYFEQIHAQDRQVRIWSAGCSSGQEPYTIAMAMHEYFGSRKSMWNTRILATDISVNVLEKAQKGIYTEDTLKEVPPQWLQKYFKKLPDGSYQVNDQIRGEVDFRTLNLMDPFRFSRPFDLVFCRNVMIYFDGPTKDKLVNKFFDWTTSGGYFFIGHSENINKATARFQFIKPAIYRRGVST